MQHGLGEYFGYGREGSEGIEKPPEPLTPETEGTLKSLWSQINTQSQRLQVLKSELGKTLSEEDFDRIRDIAKSTGELGGKIQNMDDLTDPEATKMIEEGRNLLTSINILMEAFSK